MKIGDPLYQISNYLLSGHLVKYLIFEDSHEELDEVLLVFLSDTVIDPRTVMVHPPGKGQILG